MKTKKIGVGFASVTDLEAKNISRKGFYVGCHHGLREEELAWIGSVFKRFFTTGF